MSKPETADTAAEQEVVVDDEVGQVEEGAASDEDAPDEAAIDFSKLTVVQLKEELNLRGLPTDGRKADLIARLEEHDAAELNGDEEVDDGVYEDGAEPEADYSDAELRKGEEAVDEEAVGSDQGEFVEWNKEQDSAEQVKDDEENEMDKSGETTENVTEKKKSTLEETEEDMEAKGEAEDEEFAIDISKEEDLFHLKWHSKKIIVPFKGVVVKDLVSCSKFQTVIIYPVELSDLSKDVFKRHLDHCINISLELEETNRSKPLQGYLKLKYTSPPEASAAIEELKSVKEGITVKHFTKSQSESYILSRLKKDDDVDVRGPIINRLVYIGNLTADITEATLKEQFPDALHVITPVNEETSEPTGYAYLEYANEEDAIDAAQRYQDTELSGEKLYVIKAIVENRQKFGLIRDGIRRYWVDQIQKFRKVLEKPHGKSSREISEAEQNLHMLKRRLEKDKKRRVELHLPVCVDVEESEIDNVSHREHRSHSHSEKREKSTTEKRHSHSHKRTDERPFYKKPLRRPFGGPRGRSGYSTRGGRSSYNSSRHENPPSPAKIFDQLQGLVTALQQKLPDRDSHGHPTYENKYTSGSSSTTRQGYSSGNVRQGYSRPDSYYDNRNQGGISFTLTAVYSTDYQPHSYRGYDTGPMTSTYRDPDRFTTKRRQDDAYTGADRKRRMTSYGGDGSSARYSASSTYQPDRYSRTDRRAAPETDTRSSYTRAKPQTSYRY